MKILITGGAGFIGTHLVNKLKNEHEITIFDNFLEQVHGKIPKKIRKVNWSNGITNTNSKILFGNNVRIIPNRNGNT